jgi:hypothetical protein
MVPLGTPRKCAGAGLHYLRTILGVEQPNYPEMVRQQSLADGLCSPAAPGPVRGRPCVPLRAIADGAASASSAGGTRTRSARRMMRCY